VARVKLKLTTTEYRRSTLQELDLLLQVYNDERQEIDWHFGMLASVIANVNRDSKSQPDPYTPQDFMLRRPPEPEQTDEDLLLMAEVLNEALGGRDLRPNKGAE
jgi:hypothetical protein